MHINSSSETESSVPQFNFNMSNSSCNNVLNILIAFSVSIFQNYGTYHTHLTYTIFMKLNTKLHPNKCGIDLDS